MLARWMSCGHQRPPGSVSASRAWRVLGRARLPPERAQLAPCGAASRIPDLAAARELGGSGRLRIRSIFDPTEIACLAEVIRPQYRALVFLGAYGGLRIGELAGLRRSRVDLDAGTVDVAENLTEVQGKLYSRPPKTRASRRRVSLPSVVVEELTVHLRAPAGGPLRINGFRHRVWPPATLAAGLPGLRIHDLRHTAVALWIAAGPPPRRSPPAPATPRSASSWTARPPVPRVGCGAARPLGPAVTWRDGTQTEHGRLGREQGTRSLPRCRCPELVLSPRGRDRFEPVASAV